MTSDLKNGRARLPHTRGDMFEPGRQKADLRHKPTPVLIIGAGASGLAVAHALKQRRIPVRIIDKAPRLADAWRHRHPQLRLNTHRSLSGLPGSAIPKEAGVFPGRDTVIEYLEDYAEQLDVPIDLGVCVTSLTHEKQGWRIETDAGVHEARHVVVATGHDRVPWMPQWPGVESFRGEVLHSAEFGAVNHYRDKKVLVVGAGNSGSDVLNHLSRIETGAISVSVRHGPVVFPTRMLGFPVQRLSPLMERLPLPLVDRMLNVTERLAFGNLRRWGLRKHPTGGATRLLKTGTAPAFDDGFVAALKALRVQVVPEVEAFDGAQVRLADGSSVAPDIVIAATGYRTGLEPMIGHLGVLDDRGVPLINGDAQDSRYPGLWFAGMRPRLSGFFYHAGRVGEEIAVAIDAHRQGERHSGEPAAITPSRLNEAA